MLNDSGARLTWWAIMGDTDSYTRHTTANGYNEYPSSSHANNKTVFILNEVFWLVRTRGERC